MSVVDYDQTGTDGFLDSEAKDLGDALEGVALDVNIIGEYSVGIIDDIYEAIDNNKITLTRVIDEDEDDDKSAPAPIESQSVSTKSTRATGDVERISTVTKTGDLAWSYSITENGTETYTGTVTLPSNEVDDITPGNFETLAAKFDGTLPLRRMDSDETAGSQELKMDVVIEKTEIGATIEVKELSVKHDATSIVLSNLKGAVSYEYDDTKEDDEEFTMRFMQFDTGTVRGTVAGYQLDGMLTVPEYVLNNSIKDNGFEVEEFSTQVQGGAFCLDEHNQRMQLEGGTATYTDKSGVAHAIDIQNNYGGWFHENIDGNVENLERGHHDNVGVYQDPYYDGPDANYSKYIGLKFGNMAITSSTCTNMVMDDVHENFNLDSNMTYIQVRGFCADDGKRSDLTDVAGTFTGANSVSHDFILDDDRLYTQFSGNSEGIALSAYAPYQDIMGTGVDFDRVSITSQSCTNPKVNSISFSVNEREEGLFTRVDVMTYCTDESPYGYISDAEVIYTDKSGVEYTLASEDRSPSLSMEISGNSEQLVMNSGHKNYHAMGFVNILELDNVELSSDSCENPKLERFGIYLNNEGSSFYNSGKLPKKVTFTGSIKNTQTNGEINATLNVDWLNAATMDLSEGSDETPLVDVSLAGTIKMPSRPLMLLNIGYTNPNDRNNITFGYAYDATTLNGTGAFDKEMENGLITLTTHNGIQSLIKISDGEVVYGAQSPVTRNGRAVGELQEREGVPVISYTDGTFESLP